ncbi:hypothetical protein HNQ59_000763 [Chitinivorax tropicus]|uniref:Uncharacterized protein n=1 Tax=Chitinivorax tropicus TaxID=714531 RepID=A0A840MK10_9PROT|nr:hypothetical protein [Chitinivorax tropicus]MBB5017499.1 hypothetical protein [Chitinivorax tropicus]
MTATLQSRGSCSQGGWGGVLPFSQAHRALSRGSSYLNLQEHQIGRGGPLCCPTLLAARAPGLRGGSIQATQQIRAEDFVADL